MGVGVLSACGDKLARAPKPICAHRSQNSRSYGRYRARRRRSAEIVFSNLLKDYTYRLELPLGLKKDILEYAFRGVD